MRGILFDFNGTMVFDGEFHKEAWDVFSKKYRGVKMSEKEMARAHGQTNSQIIRMLLGETMSEKEREQLSKDKEALYRECCLQHSSEYKLVDGLEELLNTLHRKGVPMTICSASIQDNIQFFIDYFQLDRWFNTKHIVYDDGSHTDKISMFHKGAAHINVPITNCIVFEDSYSGIHFAHMCNVHKIIGVNTPNHSMNERSEHEIAFAINNYKELDIERLFDSSMIYK